MNERHYNVVPECYADTVLVEILGFKRPNHVLNSNISMVIKTIREKQPNQLIVGIIDSDRGKSEKVLNGFELVEEQHDIKKFTREKHTILIICPALEGWIFQNADLKGINPKDYGFHTPKYFRQVCKKISANKNTELKRFLNDLKQKAPGFIQLKTWICEGAGINADDL